MKKKASDYHNLYDISDWKRLRHHQLIKEPLCQFCSTDDRPVGATICDHIEPHRGDLDLFFDAANLQSLCKHCHDSTKATIETRGYHCLVDPVTGLPTDPNFRKGRR